MKVKQAAMILTAAVFLIYCFQEAEATFKLKKILKAALIIKALSPKRVILPIPIPIGIGHGGHDHGHDHGGYHGGYGGYGHGGYGHGGYGHGGYGHGGYGGYHTTGYQVEHGGGWW